MTNFTNSNYRITMGTKNLAEKGLTKESNNGDNNQSTGIVLNRMYTGSYLSTNLGHEVINMFQADNGKHYLYLNSSGNLVGEGKNVKTMLLVRGIGNNRVEVVGMAKNLQPVDSACCTLPRDLNRINKSVQLDQKKFLTSKEHKVEYGTVPIIDIFGEEGQQSVYVSFWVDDQNFFKPKDGFRLILEFPPTNDKERENYRNLDNTAETDEGKTKVVRIKDHNLSSQSLRQFILEGEDLETLTELCKVEDQTDCFWDAGSEKIEVPKDIEKRRVSIFDICQIQNDENRISNALSYFIQIYPDLWGNFFKNIINSEDLGEILSVTREENAKVNKQECEDETGGRVDLLIRTKNYYIIIENKIDSDIIIDQTKNLTQLKRYYNYVKHLQENAEKKRKEYENKKEELLKKINELNLKVSKSKTPNGCRVRGWEKNITEFQERILKLDENINELNDKVIEGFVLAPDYNMPSEAERQIKDDKGKTCYTYQELRYSMIYNWLEKNAQDELSQDDNFKAFHNAIKRHTYEYENLSLYEDMKTDFFTRIKNLTSSQNQDPNA